MPPQDLIGYTYNPLRDNPVPCRVIPGPGVAWPIIVSSLIQSVERIHHVIRNSTEEDRMDHESVGRYWDANSEAWTELVRAGFDHYRDGLNKNYLNPAPSRAGRAERA